MTQALTKAHQFTWEALKLTGKHWKIALLVLLLPIIFSLLGMYWPGLEPISLPIEIRMIMKALLLPLWVMGWLRFILLEQKLTLKSYFTLDRTFWMAFLYGLLTVTVPSYLYKSIIKVIWFKDVLSPEQYTELVGNMSMMWGLGNLLMQCILLPLMLIFPALVCYKAFPLWKAWSLAKPFYGRYIISGILFLGLLSILIAEVSYQFVMLLMDHLDFFKAYFGENFGWFVIDIEQMLRLLSHNILALISYTITGVYYREFLKDKS